MSKKSGDKKNSGKGASDAVPSEQKKEKRAKGQAPVEPSDKLKFEDLGELPSGYGEMFAIARDPHWLYAYWDFDYSKFPAMRKLFLDVDCNGNHEAEVEINEIARNWYIPVQSADAEYAVTFGYRDEKGVWTSVGKAGPTRTPPESISANWETQFATVPFHLSFNFLLDVMASARAQGKNLTEALAQLQQQAIGTASSGSSWGFEQIKVLETLLGKDLLDRLFSMSSGEMLEFLHSELSGKLDSESASELLAKGRLASILAPGETSLFSGALGAVLRQELSSGGVSSFGGSELGGLSSRLGGLSSELSALSSQFLAGGSAALASWQKGIREIISKWEQAVTSLGLSSEVMSSWQAGLSEITSSWETTITSYGLSSETLASWQVGVSEIFAKWQAELSSYGLSSEIYSLSSETLASWQAGLGEITSSWEQAFGLPSSYSLSSEQLASWQKGIREIISKWEQAVTSLGLSSEVMSSWQAGLSEITSSWETTITSYGLSSETLASWQAGVSEIFAKWQAELSSYGLSSEIYSLSSETLASWQAGLGEITSSWEQAFGLPSSYSLSSEQLASWGLASWSGLEVIPSSWGLASWSGLEFGPSSWNELVSESSLFSGYGASWSAQPFGLPEREFFMHVNAEVIFYGGTHPQAKVTIDGRPVQLQPDGTFRYHFKLPDNQFEIPIVAVSPDGVETRSATLYLQRGTTRYGDVGSTPQPTYLTDPMGARR
jgi:hypothetical protein